MKDSHPFAELKEVFCQNTNRLKNTKFSFAQTHPKSTHPKDFLQFDDNL